MPICHFVSDLHGDPARWRRLFAVLREEAPTAVFLGGDLLPSPWQGPAAAPGRFLRMVVAQGFARLREDLGALTPRVFLILGNDDLRAEEQTLRSAAPLAGWEYLHGRRTGFGRFSVLGYACVPPTPFALKDWERYDVSRFVDPGCTPPEEGSHSVPFDEMECRHGTIAGDLAAIAGVEDLSRTLCLFHAPPYQTPLDRAALDGKTVDHVPLDVHVGSVALRRFIEERQPCVTLHGHVHESARLSGDWRVTIGRTHCLSAAHDGPELALVRFDPGRPEGATRTLLAAE